MSLATFINLYGTEDQCAAALAKLRWHDGFVCPKCGGRAHGHPVRADASQTNASACVARRTSRYRSRSSSRGPRDRYGAGTSAAASHGQGTAKSPDSRSATSDATTPAGAATVWRCGPSAPCRTRRAAACDRCRQRDQRIADARILARAGPAHQNCRICRFVRRRSGGRAKQPHTRQRAHRMLAMPARRRGQLIENASLLCTARPTMAPRNRRRNLALSRPHADPSRHRRDRPQRPSTRQLPAHVVH